MADRIGNIYRGAGLRFYEDELREGCDLEALFMDVPQGRRVRKGRRHDGIAAASGFVPPQAQGR